MPARQRAISAAASHRCFSLATFRRHWPEDLFSGLHGTFSELGLAFAEGRLPAVRYPAPHFPLHFCLFRLMISATSARSSLTLQVT